MIDIWLYKMTRLYTRLVTYARLHLLILVASSLSWYQWYVVLSFVHDIDYSVIFFFSYHVFIAQIVIMLNIFLFTHTHTLISSLLTTLDLHVQDFGHLLILFRCSLSSYASWESGVSLFWFWYSFLSCLPFISWFSIHIRFSLYSSSFYTILCVNAYI